MTAAIIDLQIASEHPRCPNHSQLKLWVESALQDSNTKYEEQEITIRIVDEEESHTLNMQYRSKEKPTNVLSFPFEAPAQIDLNLLGDLVICAPIVSKEAQEQSKTEISHWAHMVVHGTLHLQGYDHIENDEAEAMEALEIEVLKTLGFPNPYTIEEEITNL
jgi:probable rRNA maturation factor